MGILFHIPIPFLTLQLARQTAAKFLCQDIQGLFFFFFLFSCDSGEAPTHPTQGFQVNWHIGRVRLLRSSINEANLWVLALLLSWRFWSSATASELNKVQLTIGIHRNLDTDCEILGYTCQILW